MDRRFKRGQYTLQALVPQGLTARVVDTVQQVEAELVALRRQLHSFEGEFREVRALLTSPLGGCGLHGCTAEAHHAAELAASSASILLMSHNCCCTCAGLSSPKGKPTSACSCTVESVCG